MAHSNVSTSADSHAEGCTCSEAYAVACKCTCGAIFQNTRVKDPVTGRIVVHTEGHHTDACIATRVAVVTAITPCASCSAMSITEEEKDRLFIEEGKMARRLTREYWANHPTAPVAWSYGNDDDEMSVKEATQALMHADTLGLI